MVLSFRRVVSYIILDVLRSTKNEVLTWGLHKTLLFIDGVWSGKDCQPGHDIYHNTSTK
jgi:hypothetical protein